MIRKAMALVLFTLALGFILVMLIPTGTGKGQTIITPTLPTCTHEDGSGQALCTWDADTQGNGMGIDATSGECAVGNPGIDTDYASALCAKLWDRPEQVIAYNESEVWVADGKTLVRECLSGNADTNALECIKGELDM